MYINAFELENVSGEDEERRIAGRTTSLEIFSARQTSRRGTKSAIVPHVPQRTCIQV